MNRRHGIALIEAMIATLLLAVVLAASLQVAGISATFQARSAQRSTARFLAQALASDIVELAYENPTGTPAFGRETGETALSKVNYNDVDDFIDWTETPPQDRTGAAIAGMSGYTRSVAVVRVSAANLSLTSLTETGAKRITITISRGKTVLATRVFVRTSAP